MREPTTRAEAVRKALRAGVVDGIGVKALASTEADVRDWERIMAGDRPDHRALARFGAAYQELRELDPDAAIRWAAGVLQAAGFDREVLAHAVQVQGSAEVDREVQEAVAASARLMEHRLRRAPVEELEADSQDAVREAIEAREAIRKLNPQSALALGGGR